MTLPADFSVMLWRIFAFWFKDRYFQYCYTSSRRKSSCGHHILRRFIPTEVPDVQLPNLEHSIEARFCAFSGRKTTETVYSRRTSSTRDAQENVPPQAAITLHWFILNDFAFFKTIGDWSPINAKKISSHFFILASGVQLQLHLLYEPLCSVAQLDRKSSSEPHIGHNSISWIVWTVWYVQHSQC